MLREGPLFLLSSACFTRFKCTLSSVGPGARNVLVTVMLQYQKCYTNRNVIVTEMLQYQKYYNTSGTVTSLLLKHFELLVLQMRAYT